ELATALRDRGAARRLPIALAVDTVAIRAVVRVHDVAGQAQLDDQRVVELVAARKPRIRAEGAQVGRPREVRGEADEAVRAEAPGANEVETGHHGRGQVAVVGADHRVPGRVHGLDAAERERRARILGQVGDEGREIAGADLVVIAQQREVFSRGRVDQLV